MIKFELLKKKPAVFQSLTGLNLAAFYKLLPSFEQAYEADLSEWDKQRPQKRQRERGGGRQSALSNLENKLLFSLFSFKVYPTQEVQGYIFGMGQTQAGEWIHRLTPILNQALGYEKQLPARKAHDIAQVLRTCPNMVQNARTVVRKIRIGKKKRHTVTNNIVTDKRTKKVKVLSATCEGKKHDKKLADEQAIRFPKGSKVWKDTGFQGYKPEGGTTYQPMKKPKGKELTAEQKLQNKELSRERIGVERSIGGIKVFGIVHHIFRNFRDGYADLVMETACGWHNWRLDFRLTA